MAKKKVEKAEPQEKKVENPSVINDNGVITEQKGE